MAHANPVRVQLRIGGAGVDPVLIFFSCIVLFFIGVLFFLFDFDDGWADAGEGWENM